MFGGSPASAAQPQPTPTLQRSFSAAELSMAQPSHSNRSNKGLLLLSAEHAASLWTQVPGPSEPYGSSRCSSSASVTVNQCGTAAAAAQQIEVTSALPADLAR
jgi:hypothetical protein